MTALAADRNTLARSGEKRVLPVAAATRLFAGSMAALNSSGFLVPASTSTTLKVLGRAEKLSDNRLGANGDLNCAVLTGVFRFSNSTGGDLIAVTDIGNSCYAVDDQTVAKTNGAGTRSVAGIIFDIDAGGVWVRFV